MTKKGLTGCWLMALVVVLSIGAAATAADDRDGGWHVDMAAARRLAAESGRDMLLFFSGSDWCGWCQKLDREVFAQEAFAAAAAQNFVLVNLDFPRKLDQPEELREQNLALADRYEVTGYPTVLLTDADGTVYARTGYRAGGTEAYLSHLEQLRERYRQWRELARQAASLSSDLAMTLDRVLELQAANDLPLDLDTAARILQADSDDRHGLKTKYQRKALRRQIEERMAAIGEELGRTADHTAALAALDELVPQARSLPETCQKLFLFKANIYRKGLDDRQHMLEHLKKALECAPDSDIGQRLPAVIAELENQE